MFLNKNTESALVPQKDESLGLANVFQIVPEASATPSPRVIYVFKSHSKGLLILACLILLIISAILAALEIVLMDLLHYAGSEEATLFIRPRMNLTAICLAFNLIVFIVLMKRLLFFFRYDRYFKILRSHGTVLLNTLSRNVKCSQPRVKRDLIRAVKMKLIPQGHFSNDYSVFLVSDEKFLRFQASRVVDSGTPDA